MLDANFELFIADLVDSSPFYLDIVEKYCICDTGMIKYLDGCRGVASPYSRIYTFCGERGKVVYYQIPRCASTSILEGFLRVVNPRAHDLASRLANPELRYHFIHTFSSRYRTRSPVEDINSSGFCFSVYRPSFERIASSIKRKIIIPLFTGSPFELYVEKSFGITNMPEEVKRQTLLAMKVFEVIDISIANPDSHFKEASPPSHTKFRNYSINELPSLCTDLSEALGKPFALAHLNSSALTAGAGSSGFTQINLVDNHSELSSNNTLSEILDMLDSPSFGIQLANLIKDRLN